MEQNAPHVTSENYYLFLIMLKNKRTSNLETHKQKKQANPEFF